MIIRKTLGLLIGLLVLAVPMFAQDTVLNLPPFVAVVDDQLQLVQAGGIAPLSDKPVYQYGAVWSPDGTKLAYTYSADPANEYADQKTIAVYDTATGTSTELVTDKIATGFPISWTLDGQIFYVVDTGATDTNVDSGGMLMLYSGKVIQPVAGAQPDTVADRIPVSVGCGGGSSIPMDALAWGDSDFGGNKSVAQLTDYGIVHSAACVGAATSLTRPFSGETVAFTEGFQYNSVVSPDGQKVAGIYQEPGDSGFRSLIVVDLATLTESTYETAEPPYQVVWGEDGRLYYSTRSISGNLLADLTPEQLAQVNQVMGVVEPQLTDLPLYTSGIYVRNINDALDTSAETQLYTSSAYAIPRLAVAGNTLMFSEVTNGEAWIQAIVDGSITFENMFEVAGNYVALTLKAINLTDGSVQVVGDDFRQFSVAR